MVIQPLRRLRRSARGQGLVEFAIILPFLMLVLLMAVDFGRVFFGWVGLANASRIGASYAAGHPDAWGTPGDANQRDSYLDQILADANALNCTLPGTIPDPVFPTGTDLGDSAHVTLTCDFSLLTPLVSQILGGTITISADSIFPIRAGIAGGVVVGSVPPPPPPPPSAQLCDVPGFSGNKVNDAQTIWNAAGFTTTVIINRPPQGNYTITTHIPAVGGQPVDCDTTVVTVFGN
ncbi:MAG: TadE family protein [Chloroflexota bacterium]